VFGRPAGNIATDIDKVVANTLPKGMFTSYVGDIKNQRDGNTSMGIAMMAGILFVYLIMVALYDSYVYPFVVLFSIPVAVIGALFALALTMKALSIFSMLGFIMLIGLVAKNAILLVDRANQMKAERGMNTFDALIEAGEARLRPIMMTTVAMVFGMLPIAISGKAGSEWKSGLAWALVGGLTSSLLLTLVLVPVVYSKVDEWKVRVPAFFQRLGERLRGLFQKQRKGIQISELTLVPTNPVLVSGGGIVGESESPIRRNGKPRKKPTTA
jgi:HAE1 family hydrophobic/amphiphilic exporter-1